ncbi:MAG: hypothetical protein CMJ49_11750 [Planctomycetaceae bacterium]|nr:hypothetical protein [Planctomycetaceae bacterium]
MTTPRQNWFTRLCRNAGLAVHGATKTGQRKQTVRHETVEQQRGNITLRRTTIEEVEVKDQK